MMDSYTVQVNKEGFMGKYKISLKIFKIYLYFYTLCKLINNLMIRKINIEMSLYDLDVKT